MAEVAERQGNGAPSPEAGLYRHPVSGEEIIAQSTPKYGSPMADAFLRVGFVYVGPAPKGTQFAPDPNAQSASVVMDDGHQSVADLEAQLAVAKEREASAAATAKSSEESNTKSAKKGN